MHPTPNLLSRRYSRSGLKSFVEPPYADPHVRWCGEDGQQWPSLPDFCHFSGRVSPESRSCIQKITIEVYANSMARKHIVS